MLKYTYTVVIDGTPTERTFTDLNTALNNKLADTMNGYITSSIIREYRK